VQLEPRELLAHSVQQVRQDQRDQDFKDQRDSRELQAILERQASLERLEI